MLTSFLVSRKYARFVTVATVVVACFVGGWLNWKADLTCTELLAIVNETIEIQTGSYHSIVPQASQPTKSGCPSAVFQRRRLLSFVSIGNKTNRTAFWHCIESEGRASSLVTDAHQADVGIGFQGRVYRLAPFLSKEEVSSLLDDVRLRRFQTDSDTVDGMPTYETYLYRRGKALAPSAAHSVLCRFVAGRLLPFVREYFGCLDCVLCHAFVRRYKEGERQHVPLHQDVMSYVTVVIPLTSASSYSGGIVVKVGEEELCSDGWLRSISLDAGEAIVHGYDVAHLVHISGGERFAFVLWMQPNSSACQAGRRHA